MTKPRHPAKSVGEIGSTLLSATPGGNTVATVIPTNLPNNKEQLEALFASQFVTAFNADRSAKTLASPI